MYRTFMIPRGSCFKKNLHFLAFLCIEKSFYVSKKKFLVRWKEGIILSDYSTDDDTLKHFSQMKRKEKGEANDGETPCRPFIQKNLDYIKKIRRCF